VYLPPCYDANRSTRYPVLYLIHGQTFGDDQWDRLGADEAADALISSGQAAPFLIVMPLERDTYEDIYSGPFEWDLIEGLIPWIDANYHTCAERSCRAIGGLSRGGAWAFRLGFLHWELFGAIGLHSTPPFTGDPEHLSGWLASIPQGELPRMYMDTGRSDWYLVQTSRLENLLVQENVPHEWYLNNGTHDEEYWSAHVENYLEWYSRAWREGN
jgi:enterochelin esterase-like enzyme